jgi:Rrf2 family cysteine metabolism transcriptional repressor
MKLLTKETDYAIRTLIELARKRENYLSARDIAKAQNMPYQYIRKILQVLIKENLVISREGGRGGFILKVRPDKIKVSDVIKLFQGNIQLMECMFRENVCSYRPTCILRKNIQRIEQMVIKEFGNITVSGLLADMKDVS